MREKNASDTQNNDSCILYGVYCVTKHRLKRGRDIRSPWILTAALWSRHGDPHCRRLSRENPEWQSRQALSVSSLGSDFSHGLALSPTWPLW